MWVSEVNGARVMLVHLGDLCNVGITQREVEDVKVLRHTLFVRTLGNGHDSALGKPTEGYLGCTLAILCADC